MLTHPATYLARTARAVCILSALTFAPALARPEPYPDVYHQPDVQSWLAKRPSCKAFKDIYGLSHVPTAKNAKSIGFTGVPRRPNPHVFVAYESVFYDVRRHIAYVENDQGYPSLSDVEAPPFRVPAADLGSVRLRPGIGLGTPASNVIALLGNPAIQKGCGLQQFTYSVGPRHASVVFTIKNGRVAAIDISEDD